MRRRFAEGTIAGDAACKRMLEATRTRRTSNPAAADRAPLATTGADAAQGAIPARKRVLPRAHNLLHIPRLVRSPAGRWTLWHGMVFYAWPLLSAAARLYRRAAVARVPLIAIVGSLGKSTTAACVSDVLRLPRAARPELNGWSWVALAVLRMRPRRLAHVVEVGIDGPGQMARLADMLRPDIVVVTSITAEHNRSLPSLQVTRNEKVQMVKRLDSHGIAVLNGDDDNVRWMAKHSAGRVVYFGLDARNDVRACEIEDDWLHGTSFTLRTVDQERQLRTPLIGIPGVYATLAAIAVALQLQQDLNDVLAELATLAPVDGRMCPVTLPSGALLISDEKNSSEESIRAGLDTLASITGARKFVVMGEIFEPQGKAGPLYRSIGEQIGRVATCVLFLVGKNRLSPLRAGAQAAGMHPSDIHAIGHDVCRATDLLRSELRDGDVVLIKGRGTEHLERIALGLVGRAVRCTLPLCKAPEIRCGRCPQLEVGTPR